MNGSIEANAAGNLKRMPKDAVKVLKEIWAVYAGHPFDDEKVLELDVPPLSGAEVMAALSSLRREGWIRAARKAWGERFYYLPEDKLYVLHGIWFPAPEPAVDQTPATTVREASTGLALDLFNALVYTAKSSGLPLTAKGMVHKKHIQRLDAAGSGMNEEDIAGIGLKYDQIEIYPPRTAVLLDLMTSLGLADLSGSALTLNEEAVRDWMELPCTTMNRLLFQAVMERYGSKKPDAQHVRLMLCHPGMEPGIWYDVDRLQEVMTEAGLTGNGGLSSLREEAVGWLRFLAGAGWVDYGISSGGHPLIRWKVAGNGLCKGVDDARTGPDGENGMLYVQPDFEVLVPPDIPYSVRWKLALCSERVADDHLSVYRLTREAAASAADLGMSPGDIRRFLEREASGGVPDNVAGALEQWGREVGRLAFAELTVLQCRTAEEADWIGGRPELMEGLQRIGPLHFTVSRDRVPELRKRLAAAERPAVAGLAGFVQAAVGKSETEGTSGLDRGTFNRFTAGITGGRARYAPGLVQSGRGLHEYEPDEELPDRQSLFPGIGSIPIMWTRDWRSYHSSTAREIMELALGWQTAVELGTEQGVVRFVPKRLLRSPWRISGETYLTEAGTLCASAQCDFADGEWKEMRLLLPEVH